MKKMTKIFGTVAVSAALAIGTAMPAFADPGLAGDATGDKQDHAVQGSTDPNADKPTMSTDVLAYYDKSASESENQVSAAVPLGVYVVINPSGNTEQTIITPSNYYIKNTGKNTVEVTNVNAKMNTNGKVTWSAVATGTTLTTTKTMKMLFTTGAKQIDLATATTSGYTNFGLTIAEGSSAGFDIVGKSFVSTSDAGSIQDQTELADKLFDMTYTIAKATA